MIENMLEIALIVMGGGLCFLGGMFVGREVVMGETLIAASLPDKDEVAWLMDEYYTRRKAYAKILVPHHPVDMAQRGELLGEYLAARSELTDVIPVMEGGGE